MALELLHTHQGEYWEWRHRRALMASWLADDDNGSCPIHEKAVAGMPTEHLST